ncbi:hypothetical protein Ciccas_002859 [Cichlidogyrus casuarinus]|uniref:Uncharacterized protein n=1 Tax=Cichlidogyrus casuarinus TaxID=1844966 RepID=A0ABD2QG14_9PLAT
MTKKGVIKALTSFSITQQRNIVFVLEAVPQQSLENANNEMYSGELIMTVMFAGRNSGSCKIHLPDIAFKLASDPDRLWQPFPYLTLSLQALLILILSDFYSVTPIHVKLSKN